MQIPETEIIVSKDGAELLRKTVRPGDYVIGSEPGCEVQVDIESVSPRHAQLAVSFDHVLIEDLGSDSGTFVNGQRVRDSTRLYPNQKIQIGAATIELHRLKTAPPQPDDTVAPNTAAVQRLLPEEFLRDKKYDIGKVVAQGGMGAILDAKEVTTERKVAMKVMLDGASPDDLTRFIAEAKVTAQLEHPNVVPVHELGVDENGQPFYTMKMVRGITLRKVLELLAEGVPETVKKYPLPILLTIFQKVCDAIAFGHSKGVIHRDLKPENIMLDDFGVVLVMDWGLAKVIGQKPAPVEDITRSLVRTVPPETTSATIAGSIMGTPQYMSPEQARGEVEDLDVRSDIYALGAILYHLLALRPPVTGRAAMEIVGKVAEGRVEPLTAPKNRSIPDGIAAVVRKAMSFDRDQRYPHVADLQYDIEAYQNGRATRAENASLGKQLVLLVKRHTALFSTAFAAWLIITALAVWFVINITKAKNQAEAERSRATANEKRAVETLQELKGTAPTFEAQSRALLGEGKLEEALEKIGYAVRLAPEYAGYGLTRAHLLQSTQRLPEAAQEYRRVLALEAGNAAAQENLDLSEKLLAENGGTAELPVKLQNTLLDALIAQHRDLEAAPLATRLHRDSDTARAAILARLTFYTQQPGWLKATGLKSLDGSTFQLNLRGLQIGDLNALHGLPISDLILEFTSVSDLRPLAGLPLERLNLDNTPVTDLTPLRGMKLRSLSVYRSVGTGVQDLTPLAGMPLESLTVGPYIVDLSPLRGAPLRYLRVHSCYALRDLSPLAGMKLERLFIDGTKVTDLSPLRGMPLKELDLSDSSVRDGAPLANNGTLEKIHLPWDIVDIAFFRTLPKLQQVEIHYSTREPIWYSAKDFFATYDPNLPEIKAARAALASAGLDNLAVRRIALDKNHRLKLDLAGTYPSELPRLHDLPISQLTLPRFTLRSLEALRGMPLAFIDTFSVMGESFDISALADCHELEAVRLGPNACNVERLRTLPKLRYLSTRLNANTNLPAQTAEQYWKEYDSQNKAHFAPVTEILQKMGVKDVSPQRLTINKFGLLEIDLKGVGVSDLSLFAGLPIASLNLTDTNVTDLSPLRGMPLMHLDLTRTPVKDLSPLQGMGLKHLHLNSCPVSDLTPLQGMPLEELLLSTRSVVTDLTPLRGMPLINLALDGTNDPDLTPLAECKDLKLIKLPLKARHVEVLRKLPNLQQISSGWVNADKMPTAAIFWKEYDAQQAAGKK